MYFVGLEQHLKATDTQTQSDASDPNKDVVSDLLRHDSPLAEIVLKVISAAQRG